MITFPKDFYWGAAASAYQVEGDNTNSDWWDWEIRRALKFPSQDACRHYQFFRQDFDIAKELSHNAHRLSIEWARIQPKAGEFSQQELEHYRQVIGALRERNIEPVVTLHHFTNPLWFSDLEGWVNNASQKYFLDYVEKVVTNFADKVRFWVTINEPMVYLYHSYILATWPPQERSYKKAGLVLKNLGGAHIKAYRLIHRIYKQKKITPCYVSIAKNVQFFVRGTPTLRNSIALFLRDRFFNFALINKLARHKALDFIGINYYTRGIVDVEGWLIRIMLYDAAKSPKTDLKKNSLGWDIFPEGLHNLLLRFKKYRLPIFILENGICTDDDSLRWEFIRRHLMSLNRAMRKGVEVWGYLYWSLLDNFEWDKGFAPRFGLVKIDYNTQKRAIRESARKFAQVCKTGVLDT